MTLYPTAISCKPCTTSPSISGAIGKLKYTASTPTSAKEAVCIRGENELVIPDPPTRPVNFVSPEIARSIFMTIPLLKSVRLTSIDSDHVNLLFGSNIFAAVNRFQFQEQSTYFGTKHLIPTSNYPLSNWIIKKKAAIVGRGR